MQALLVVDFQVDFCPGGALAVSGGDEIAATVNTLAARAPYVVATRDWHPEDHGSFIGVTVDPADWNGADPPSIWPVHCVQGTPGAALHPGFLQGPVNLVVDKGIAPNAQGYSAFQDTNLAADLRALGIDHLVVVGLATDYCVLNSVLDAIHEGFGVTVVREGIRAVDVADGDGRRALERMAAAGARIVDAADDVVFTA